MFCLSYLLRAALIFSSLFFFSSLVFSQDENLLFNTSIEEMIESYTEKFDKINDFTPIYEDFDDLISNPINLNTYDYNELRKIPFLSDIQIRNLIQHIKKNGNLLSIYELQSIDGFDLETIEKILPYIELNIQNNIIHKNLFNNTKKQLFFKVQQILQKQNGYDNTNNNSYYLGSPQKIYTRFRMNNNNLSIGITAEKDPGEEIFKGSQKQGFDFYSAHLLIKTQGLIKTIAFGDYIANFGQGLTLGYGFSYGSTSSLSFIKKNAQGISPFTSSDENNFLRGSAATIKYKNFEYSIFYSNKKIDANITNDSSMTFSSLQEAGIHATINQIKDKDAIKEQLIGSHINYSNNRKINIGFTINKSIYNGYYQKTTQLYNLYKFKGNNNLNIGLDYNFIFKNSNFFGEISESKNGGIAFLNGFLLCPAKKLSLMLLNRYYQAKYQNLYSNAYSQNTYAENEFGTLMAIELKPSSKLTLYGSADIFHFPWLRYNIDAPSDGIENRLQLTYRPTRKIESYIIWKYNSKQHNTDSYFQQHHIIDSDIKNDYRFHISYPISKSFTFRDRVEILFFNSENKQKQGFLIYHDIIFKKNHSPFSFSFRYCLFDTDDYDTRIYAYENDMLYNYSIPFFYYKGRRYYLNFHYKINKLIEIWLRYSETYLINRNIISSGPTQINGNTKSEVKIQVRILF
jgi:hypothetical protein